MKVNFSTQAFSTFFKDALKNTQPPRYSPISLPSGIHTLCNTISHCTRFGLVISRWQGKWWYVTSKFKLWKTSVSILDILSLALFFLLFLVSLALGEATFYIMSCPMERSIAKELRKVYSQQLERNWDS